MKILLKIAYLLLLVTSTLSFAQTTGSTIEGKVTSKEGEPIPLATIELIHEPTGTSFSTVSNQEGFYTIPNVIAGGPYTLTASEINYQDQKVVSINVDLGESIEIPVILSQGVALSEVIVSKEKSRSLGVSTNIDSKVVKRIPTIARTITDFTRLVPQSNGGSSFAGASNKYNLYSIDGNSYNNNFGLGSQQFAGGNPISIEVIDQVQVDLSPIDMSISGFTGAAVNATTKAGTNEFHAEAYSYLQNEQMIGDDPSDSKSTTRGFTVGGPIIKDKVFFFAGYEEVDNSIPGFTVAPSQDGVGNGSTISRVRESDLLYIQSQLQTLYGYDTGAYGSNIPFINQAERLNIRFDWNINDKNKLWVRYNTYSQDQSRRQSGTSTRDMYRFRGTSRTGIDAIPFQNNQYLNSVENVSIAAELRSQISDNMTNVFRFGTREIKDPQRTFGGGVFPMIEIMTGDYYNGDTDMEYYTSVGNELFSVGNQVTENGFSINNDFTWVNGKHTIKAGFKYQEMEFSNAFNPVFHGIYRLVGNTPEEAMQHFTDVVVNKTPGVYPAAFVKGFALDGTTNMPLDETKFTNFAFYLQDDFQINDDLKVSAGFRIETPNYPIELKQNDAVAALNQTFSVNGKPYSPDHSSFPDGGTTFSFRAGGIYDINGDGKYNLRLSTGINQGFVPFVWLSNQPANSGVLRAFQGYDQHPDSSTYLPEDEFKAVMDSFQSGDFQFTDDVTYGNPTGDALAETVPSGTYYTDPDFKLPSNWRTSIAFDAELPLGITAGVNLLYTKYLQGIVVKDIIANEPDLTFSGPDTRKYWSGSYESDPNYRNVWYLSNIRKDDLPQSWSVTLNAAKSFGDYFDFSIAYTTGKAEDNGALEGATAWSSVPSTVAQDRNNPEIGFAQWDVRNRVISTLSYQKGNTSIVVFYRGQNMGRYSYTYGGHADRSERLLYIPNSASELNFIPTSDYTAAQQVAAFDAFIDQDDYLSENRGKIAERYGATLPYLGRYDVKLIQGFDIGTVEGYSNKIELSLDILNIGNLLNQNSGVAMVANSGNSARMSPLSYEGPNNAGEPTWTMNEVNGSINYGSYRESTSVFNNWSMQFGIRYIFN